MIIDGFGIYYMLNVCLLSRYLSAVIEIYLDILSGMLFTRDKQNVYITAETYFEGCSRQGVFFMEVATAKTEVTTRTGLP